MKTLLISILAVAILSIVFISSYLAPNDLADCHNRPEPTGKCRAADAIVVVSGGDTQARTAEGILMYQNGWAPQIIFSGAAEDTSGPSNAQVMRQQAIEAGVPSDAIITEDLSRTTAENAQQNRILFRQLGIERVMLITSAYHQRRAGLEFEKRTDENVQIVNHPVATDRQWSEYWWTTPTGWYLAVSELVKIAILQAGGRAW